MKLLRKYYQNEPRFNGVYSSDNLPNKVKDGVYIINLDEHFDIGTHWIALYILNDNVTYFDSFGVEHIPKEIKKFIDKSTIVTSIFRIQAYDSVMCGYFCIGFIDFMLESKSLTDFTNLFSPNDFKKNDDIILNYFLTSLEKWLKAIPLKTIHFNAIPLKHLMYIQMINSSNLNIINEINKYFIEEIKERILKALVSLLLLLIILINL